MQTSARNLFTTIRSQGALLPADFLQRVADGSKEIDGLEPGSYHLLPGEKLNEAINRSWNRLIGAWTAFRASAEKLIESDLGTRLTYDRWLLPLFQELGYGHLQRTKSVEVDGKPYPISHCWANSPIHLVGFRVDLDRRTAGVTGAARTSPHGLVQELLNRSDTRLWGFVSNGQRLRVLRDNITLTRQAYVEFDLQSMFEGEVYADFVVLWLVCHQSRVEAERPELCWLEKWSQLSEKRGTRALEDLRIGVEAAINALGTGFLAHRENRELRRQLSAAEIKAQDYYRQLLRVVYRVLFLFVAEERGLLFDPKSDVVARELYSRFYSIVRLRRLAERRVGTQHTDLWRALTLIFEKLEGGCRDLALPALGSFLWSPNATGDLLACELSNRDLLKAIHALAFTVEGRVRRIIDYKNLGSEELGSIYEALLELHPRLNIDAGTFDLSTAAGHERKTTGSYYTPTSLVKCLLDSALEPVLDAASKRSTPEEAILNLKICDPAAGSGHFLISAAHRVAKRLASVRTGDEEPSPEATRTALRDVIGRCLYGVDVNPMAVELCKISLWMEALEPGKPLSFLDHHIQCGNSLLGASPRLLYEGLPDGAFKPVPGDDKEYSAEAKRRNKDERKQLALFHGTETKPWDHLGNLPTAMLEIDTMRDDTASALRQKEHRYSELVHSTGYLSSRFLADAWCAAFVWKKTREFPYPITNDVLRKIERNPHDCPTWMRAEIERLRDQYSFFHWHLAFPDVFWMCKQNETPENEESGWSGGFDIVLGNPPWEKINLKDEEFFAETHPEIAAAATKSERKRLLDRLAVEEPIAFARYEVAKNMHDRTSAFFRLSGSFPLTGVSRINLYSVFCETGLRLLAPAGRFGMVLASGIVTDDNNKDLFFSLIANQRLIHGWDFENSLGIFPGVHRSYKFLLLCAGGAKTTQPNADFAFYLSDVAQLKEQNRHFSLSADELQLLNPLSRTCPTFRNQREAEIAKRIYRSVPAWSLHAPTADWPGTPKTPFNMSNDSGLFVEKDALIPSDGGEVSYLPLYESKFVHQFNHRYATFIDCLAEVTVAQVCNPSFRVEGRYWLDSSVLHERFPGKWFLVWRDITCATNERTSIATIIPDYPCAHTLSLVDSLSAHHALLLGACLNSIIYDYCARQKVAGTHLNHSIWKQLPVVSASTYAALCAWSGGPQKLKEWLLPRVFELSYTAWDLEPFANDCGWIGPPFIWDGVRRFRLRCELDAAFFRVYGVARDEVEYILETFPIVKARDEAAYNGEFRTKDVILETFDAMAESTQSRKPYETRLDPIPASFRQMHLPRLPESERSKFQDAEAYLAQFIMSVLRQARGETDLDLVQDAFTLLIHREKHRIEIEAVLGDLDWFNAFSAPLDANVFRSILERLVAGKIVHASRENGRLRLSLKNDSGQQSDPWIALDASVALSVLARRPDIQELLPDTLPASFKDDLQKMEVA